MGTPEFSVPTLQILHEAGHEIVSVVTQPDKPKGRGQTVLPSPVKVYAETHGIPVLQPPKVKKKEVVEELRKLEPDVTIVIAFGQILSQEVLDIPKYYSINLHASVLPKYRGAAPLNWVLVNGEKETGVTSMRMDAGMDTGDILLIRKVGIGENDNAQTLHDTLSRVGAEVIKETVNLLEAGKLTPIPQNDVEATYAPKLKKQDGLIQWNRSAMEIRNLVRGFEPWPGAFTFLNSKRIRVCRVEICQGEPKDIPGTIARISDYGVEVGTSEGRVLITELQPEGKKRMPVKNFLQGNALKVGQAFETPDLQD